jgi:hypothetical protein
MRSKFVVLFFVLLIYVSGKIPFAEVEAALNSLNNDIQFSLLHLEVVSRDLTRLETKKIKALAILVQAELKGKDKRFESKIVPFMDEAERTLKHLEDLFKETCGLFLDMCLYFGYPEAKVY